MNTDRTKKNKIRKAVYAAALTLSAMTFCAHTAPAQEMRGSFTLKNEVHWQNTVIPAGDYRFTMKSNSPASILTLSKISSPATSYMLLVNDSAPSASEGSASRIVLVPRAEGKFVSAMELPDYGTTLHFVVPAETPAKVAVSQDSTATVAAR